MSDIVESLRDAAGGNDTHVCAIAAAEIERNLSQIEQLDARCGRLRDACATWERASNNYAEAVEIKDAMIKRLQADVVHWRESRRICLAAGDMMGDMMKAENERLRGLLRECLICDPRGLSSEAENLDRRIREALGDQS